MTAKKGKTILVCRDKFSTAQMTIELIPKHNTIILVSGFPKLLEQAEAGCDLIIMGLGADGRGLEILRKLRNNFPNKPIFVTSQTKDKELLAKALAFGATKAVHTIKDRKEYRSLLLGL